MKAFLIALTGFVLLGAATPAAAACGWSGTQFECDLGGSVFTVGTQQNPTPACAVFSLQGCETLPTTGTAAERPVTLGVQNVGVDPSLCQRIGNETYCY